MEHPLLQSEENAIGVTSKFIFYNSYMYYYELINDRESKYQTTLKTIKLLEDHPDFQKRCMQNYFLLRGRELFVTIIKNPEEYEQKRIAYEGLAEEYVFDYEAQQALKDIYKYQLIFCETVYHCLKFDEIKIKEFHSVAVKELDVLENRNYGFFPIELFHYLAKALFELGEYDKARFWCERIEENLEKNASTRIFLVISSKLLYLFVLYRQGEYNYLKNKVDALKRFLKRNDVLDDYFTLLLKAIRLNLGKLPTKNTSKNIVQKIAELKPLKTEIHFDEVLFFDSLEGLELIS